MSTTTPYVLGRFSQTQVYDDDQVQRVAAQASIGGLARSQTALELDNQGLDSSFRSQRSCLDNVLHDNSAPGRLDNLPRTTTVYKPEEHRMDLFEMPGNDMLSWGVVPHVTRNGGFRPEWHSPRSLKAPKREITREEMYAVEGNANRQWGEGERIGTEYVREYETNRAHGYTSARGALDDYTVHDFEHSASGIAGCAGVRKGDARGRYWTERTGPSTTRIVYPGDLMKGLVQYPLRPMPNNSRTIGGPVVPAQHYRHKGKWAEKSSISEYNRGPVRQTHLGVKKQAVTATPILRHTNRQMPLRLDGSCMTATMPHVDQSELIAGPNAL